jgi:hypothetical protein
VKQLNISVTQEHINEGRPGNPCLCPVALALNALPSVKEASVGVCTADFSLDGQDIAVNLPETAEDRIHDFDRYGVMEPFEFCVEIP